MHVLELELHTEAWVHVYAYDLYESLLFLCGKIYCIPVYALTCELHCEIQIHKNISASWKTSEEGLGTIINISWAVQIKNYRQTAYESTT